MYCRAKGYNHYIRPSTYQAILKNSGYNNEENLTAAQKEKNHKIRKALYREGCIDRIEPGVYNYEEFCGIRNDEGLSLSRVNALHRDIKQRLVTQKFNVCSKFLSDYLGFYSFIHNWTIDHNGVVPSSNADATEILLLILKQQKPFTWQAINDTELKLPQPNRRFLKMLAEKTFAGRQALGSPFLKFNEEEGASPLQQRKFLCSLGEKELRKVCRANHIIGYSNFSIGGMAISILRLKNADAVIANLISELRPNNLGDAEDAALEAALKRNKSKDKNNQKKTAATKKSP